MMNLNRIIITILILWVEAGKILCSWRDHDRYISTAKLEQQTEYITSRAGGRAPES